MCYVWHGLYRRPSFPKTNCNSWCVLKNLKYPTVIGTENLHLFSFSYCCHQHFSRSVLSLFCCSSFTATKYFFAVLAWVCACGLGGSLAKQPNNCCQIKKKWGEEWMRNNWKERLKQVLDSIVLRPRGHPQWETKHNTCSSRVWFEMPYCLSLPLIAV